MSKLKKLFKIAKAVAPVVVPLIPTLIEVGKQAKAAAKTKKKPNAE